jgi:hypothetical protein
MHANHTMTAKRFAGNSASVTLKEQVDVIRYAWKADNAAARKRRKASARTVAAAVAVVAIEVITAQPSAILTIDSTVAEMVVAMEQASPKCLPAPRALAALPAPTQVRASYVDHNTPTSGDYHDLPFSLSGEVKGRLKKLRPMTASDLPGQLRMF